MDGGIIEFDSITDNVCYMNNGIKFKFVTKLAHKDKNGYRVSAINKIKYTNKYYKSPVDVYSISRNHSFYYIIDTQKFDNNIIIRDYDCVMLRIYLRDVLNWFTDGTFATNENGEYYIAKKRKPTSFEINGKMLLFAPTILENGTFGVLMSINKDPDTTTEYSRDVFLSMFYCIEHADIYTWSSSMLNFLTAKDIHDLDVFNMAHNSDIMYDRPGIKKSGFFK